MDEFVTAILKNRKPLVDISRPEHDCGRNRRASIGDKDGELLKIPQF